MPLTSFKTNLLSISLLLYITLIVHTTLVQLMDSENAHEKDYSINLLFVKIIIAVNECII